MTNPVLVKRSAVPGRVPNTSQLAAGELAINTADAKLFFSTGTLVHEVAKKLDLIALASTFPEALGTASVGVGTTAARADHIHEMPDLDALANVDTASKALNDFLTWNGESWVNSASVDGAYSVNISSWTLASGNLYYADVVHNLGTQSVAVSLWDTSNNAMVLADSIVATSATTLRVTVAGNSKTIRCVVLANGRAIAAGGSTPSSIIVQDEGVAIAGNPHTILNFTGAGVTVVDAGGGIATVNINAGAILRTLTYYASSLDSPNNANWAVNSLAAAISDPVNAALSVRQFSNTTENGVGFNITVPNGATNVTFNFKGRAQTAPGSAAVVQPKLYIRGIPNNAAVGAWSSAYNLSNIGIPTNTYFQYSSQTFSIASLGLAVGNMYQCELTRSTTVSGGTQLASNWYLAELTVEFS